MSNLFDENGYLSAKIQQRIFKEFSMALIEELFTMAENRVEVLALQSYLNWEISDRTLERLMNLKDSLNN